MLSRIAAHARACADETGRESLSPAVMEAMAKTPREIFVSEDMAKHAYDDTPLPIGADKTISQPFMVALAADLLELDKNDKVLEVGAGCGYQSAVLSLLCRAVFAIEIVQELGEAAQTRLSDAGFDNVRLRIGDGSRGWPEEAQFDGIVVSAGARRIPRALVDQLAPGGKMVVPAGPDDAQMLKLLEKDDKGEVRERDLIPVRYSELSIAH